MMISLTTTASSLEAVGLRAGGPVWPVAGVGGVGPRDDLAAHDLAPGGDDLVLAVWRGLVIDRRRSQGMAFPAGVLIHTIGAPQPRQVALFIRGTSFAGLSSVVDRAAPDPRLVLLVQPFVEV